MSIVPITSRLSQYYLHDDLSLQDMMRAHGCFKCQAAIILRDWLKFDDVRDQPSACAHAHNHSKEPKKISFFYMSSTTIM